MENARRLEIALEVLRWWYSQVGTEQFMLNLHDVAEATKIPDEEMFEFFSALAEEMIQKKN